MKTMNLIKLRQTLKLSTFVELVYVAYTIQLINNVTNCIFVLEDDMSCFRCTFQNLFLSMIS